MKKPVKSKAKPKLQIVKANTPPPTDPEGFQVNPRDPLQIHARLYKQVSMLLDDLETMDDNDDEDSVSITIRERIAALVAIGRLSQIFLALRKGSIDATGTAGSRVRKYATAFAPNAAGGGTADTRGGEPEPDDWFEQSDADAAE